MDTFVNVKIYHCKSHMAVNTVESPEYMTYILGFRCIKKKREKKQGISANFFEKLVWEEAKDFSSKIHKNIKLQCVVLSNPMKQMFLLLCKYSWLWVIYSKHRHTTLLLMQIHFRKKIITKKTFSNILHVDVIQF